MLTYLGDAVELLDTAIQNEQHITIYGDYDVDGLTCLQEFIKLFSMIDYTNYDVVKYTKRTHSIDRNIASILLENKSSLCIICDTGSAEPDTLQYLNSLCPIIVLDHHRGIINKSHINDSLVVVNPAIWGDNVKMSAGCVTYEVIMEWVVRNYDEYETQYFQKSLAFYPFVSLYADSAYGNNDYCHGIYQQAQDSLFPIEYSFVQANFVPTKRFVLFSVAPPINAAFRNNRLDLINELFLRKSPLLSYERQNLFDDLQMLRSETRKYINKLEEVVEPQMVGKFALVDLTGYLNQDIPNEIIWANKGLIANKIADKHTCACICIVNTGSEYTLSVRDFLGRDILKYMEVMYKVGGHASAFGGTLKATEVLGLKQYLGAISNRLDDKVRREEFNFLLLSTPQLEHIASINEFLPPNEVHLVRIMKNRAKLDLTPASWGPQYYQYRIDLPSKGPSVYVRQEDFDDDTDNTILVHLYKGKKMKGSMIRLAK